jgi:hypothetical protein
MFGACAVEVDALSVFLPQALASLKAVKVKCDLDQWAKDLILHVTEIVGVDLHDMTPQPFSLGSPILKSPNLKSNNSQKLLTV